MTKWDKRYMELAQLIASWSKDPNKQVGAVVTLNNYVKGQGYNGFPRGLVDDDILLLNKDLKNKMVIHAEVNAILAAGARGDTLYVWPCLPCSSCMALIIQVGITRVVIPRLYPESSWDQTLPLKMAAETGVTIITMEGPNEDLCSLVD